jgi:glycosyltransferase involved in cell wall biosynthesis
MRIAHVITRFHLGGAEEVAINLATGLALRGHESRVISLRPAAGIIGEAQKQFLASMGVLTLELQWPSRLVACATIPLRLASFWRRWQPDIVHSHTDIPDFMVALAARQQPVRVARSIQNTVLWPTHWYAGYIAEAAFRHDLVVACSDGTLAAYRALRARYRLMESPNQRQIGNAFSRLGCHLADEQCSAGKLSKGDVTRFCFAGRLVPQKGLDLLLDALSLMSPDRLLRLELHVFGDGPDREIHKRRAMEQGLPVVFRGTVPRVSRHFPGFDALVAPSRHDGIPLVVGESLATGLPVVATMVPGLAEALPADWPLLVPPEDAGALARMLSRVVDGRFDLDELRMRGKEWAQAQFATEPMLDRYEEAYRDFLKVPA